MQEMYDELDDIDEKFLQEFDSLGNLNGKSKVYTSSKREDIAM